MSRPRTTLLAVWTLAILVAVIGSAFSGAHVAVWGAAGIGSAAILAAGWRLRGRFAHVIPSTQVILITAGVILGGLGAGIAGRWALAMLAVSTATGFALMVAPPSRSDETASKAMPS